MILSWHGIKSEKSALKFSALHPMFKYEVPRVADDVVRFLKRAPRLVVVGMGGSVLPLQAFTVAAGLEDRVIILDSLERSRLNALLKDKDCVFCIVSKSGETLEVKAVLQEILDAERAKDCLFVTDPERGSLRRWAREWTIPSLPIPPELGGRFTNFSVFHRAVLEKFGIDFDKLLTVAKNEADRLKNDAGDLTKLYASIFDRPTSSFILWNYCPSLRGALAWAQQAIAESLGKRTKSGNRIGSLPVILEGPKDQHSVLQLLMEGPQDKALWFFSPPESKPSVRAKVVKDFESLKTQSLESIQFLLAEATFRSFQERTNQAETSQPLVKFQVQPGLEDLTRFIVLIQAFVEAAGEALSINAFDQPGVERGKQIARELLMSQS